MEHPVTGFASHRQIRKKTASPLVLGGTSLKLSEGGSSPVLEAHPGSPVDITGPRPSLASSMASAHLYHPNSRGLHRSERSPRLSGKIEEAIRWDGVAAKEYSSVGNRDVKNENENMIPQGKRMQVAGLQPFYIPAKVPEQDEIQQDEAHPMSNLEDKRFSIDMAMDPSHIDQVFDFETDNGIWISANPLARESRTSIATTTTAASTLVDERMSHGALTVDTSVASSAASMMSSSAASTYSATTTTGSDVYGWEEELDRKTSIEGQSTWERELQRRLPSGGRTIRPRLRGSMNESQSKREDGKRKSLLYRVLNISGSLRTSVDDTATTTPGVFDCPCPTTSA
jgi:hypothetical protein